MAGNLPIQIPYKLSQQPMLQQAGMPKMTLPPLRLPDISLGQSESIFTPTPLFDVTKIPKDSELSSIFQAKNNKLNPINISENINSQKAKQKHISKTELQKEKEKIREMLKAEICNDIAINCTLDAINEDNLEIVKIICNNKKIFNSYASSAGHHFPFQYINSQNSDFAKWLFQNETFTNEKNIWNSDFIIKNVNAENKDLAYFLCQNNDFLTDEHIPSISYILKYTNAENKDLAYFLCQNNDFLTDDNVYRIGDILQHTNAEKKDFAFFVCQNKNITKNRCNILTISNILECINTENKDFAKLLCQNNDFIESDEKFCCIPNILLSTNAQNRDFAEWFCTNANDFIKYDTILAVQKLLKSINSENKDLAKLFFQNLKTIPDVKNYNLDSIVWLITQIDATNKDFFKQIFGNKNFMRKDNINNIIPIFKQLETYPKLIKIMCNNENFTTKENIKYIPKIIEHGQEDFEFVKKIIYSDEKYEIFRRPENIYFIAGILDAHQFLPELTETICTDEKYKEFREGKNIAYICDIIATAKNTKITDIEKILLNKNIPMRYRASMLGISKCLNDFNLNYDEIFQKFIKEKEKIMKNPGLYLNESFHSKKEATDKVNKFFILNQLNILLAAGIFDKETLDCLFRQRFEDAERYFFILMQFNPEELQLLKKIISCNNVSDKPLLPSQKIGCIDLIAAFHNNQLDYSFIENEIKDNKIDLGKIELNLFKTILKNCGLDEETIKKIPKEKLLTWNLDYMHFLSHSMDEDVIFLDLLMGALLVDDFIKFIHEPECPYRQQNKITKNAFNKIGMNYEKWVYPDKSLETTFISKDQNSEILVQHAASVSEDIKELRNTPVKGFFDKQFRKYIQNDEFKIPQEIVNSKANLIGLINNIIEQLKPVWERAENNKNKTEKQETARKTLTILSHLKTKLNSLKNMNGIEKNNSYNLTIKMWDREPQKDLFQGNYSTCCIGMGEVNAFAMPVYLMSTAFNMIELVDNYTGKTIGNALCYFVKDKKNTPIFVIDNIEINNSKIPSDKTGIELRKKIFEYAENIAKSITGQETKVIISTNYNDVKLENGLIFNDETLKLIGDFCSNIIYMDLFDGWTENTFKNVRFAEKIKQPLR